MKIQAVEKTDKLNPKQFKSGTQKFVICQALAEFPDRVSVEDVIKKARELGYENLLNDWAKVHGGPEGSVRYHLPKLEELQMIRTFPSDAKSDTTTAQNAKSADVMSAL